MDEDPRWLNASGTSNGWRLPWPGVEEIADALQGCFNDAVEAGMRRAKEEIRAEFGPRFDRQDATIREIRDHMDERLDRQDETLRMVWKQVKGNGKLPIDDYGPAMPPSPTPSPARRGVVHKGKDPRIPNTTPVQSGRR